VRNDELLARAAANATAPLLDAPLYDKSRRSRQTFLDKAAARAVTPASPMEFCTLDYTCWCAHHILVCTT
jgi:hypothetical protein